MILGGIIALVIILLIKKHTKDPIQRSDLIMYTAILCSSNLGGLVIGLLAAIWYSQTEDGKTKIYYWND